MIVPVLRLSTLRALLALVTVLAPVLGIFTALAAPVTVSAAPTCTMYAAPNGSSSNSGASPSSPLTLVAARDRTVPGSVVCLLGGAYAVDTPFEITRSGTASAWITYRSYDGNAVITPRSNPWALMQVPNGVRYIEISGLQFDGQNTAADGLTCKGTSHVRFIGNQIRNTGKGGIVTFESWGGQGCDYVTVDGNWVHRAGYGEGWSSGISLNSHSWSDGYRGFHSVVANNIVSGSYDGSYHHSDGNGIIVDNQYGQNSPPVLLINNVVYQNGARCLHSRYARQVWFVNNTCYKNGLDPNVVGGNNGNNGEFILYGSAENFLINNIAYAWGDRRPYSDEAASPARYFNNMWYTSGNGRNWVPSSVANNPGQLRQANPLFINPPYVDPNAGGQYNNALVPSQLTNHLHLQSGSPAREAGIDPTTVAGIWSEAANDLRRYAYRDRTGAARPQGNTFDLGAYESGGGSPPPPTATLPPLPTATPPPPPTGGGQASADLYATADAYVDSYNPNSNYGGTSPLWVEGGGRVVMPYFKFDLSSLAGKTITSARLRIRVWDGFNNTLNLRSVADTSWGENGVTWNNRPQLGLIVGRVQNPQGSTWVEFDITNLVRASAGQTTTYALDTLSTDALFLPSREIGQVDIRPMIVVR